MLYTISAVLIALKIAGHTNMKWYEVLMPALAMVTLQVAYFMYLVWIQPPVGLGI